LSQFRSLNWSLARAEAELNSFKTWFCGQSFVGERAIVKEIEAREHMCGLLAGTAGFNAPDLIKRELTLRGLFRTDLVLGNNAARQFALIEFEGAEATSIFSGRQTAQYRHWSRQLEHGFGQVTDWAWVKSDAPNDITLTTAFGGVVNASAFLIICGRDASMRDDMEKRRFNHRQNSVKIDGVPARIMTYDDMLKAMEVNLAAAKSFSVLP
jgi:Domain of unknown function (DUF4263)